MPVLLINPPYAALKGALEVATPLHLPYIAAVLDQNNINCQFLNLDGYKLDKYLVYGTHDIYDEKINANYYKNLRNANHPIWLYLKKQLMVYQPEIVGISSTTSSYDSALKVAKIVKYLIPKVKIIYGGPHATVEYKEIINEKVIDFIIRGEGEYAFLELVKAIKAGFGDLTNILGLSYRINNRPIHNQPRPVVKDLDKFPSPQKFYQLVDPHLSHISVITNRGCNKKCSYCPTPYLWGGIRSRSIANVVDEIKESLNYHKTKWLFFLDADFNYDKQRTINLCQVIQNEDLDVSWGFVGNLDIIDDEICHHLKKAGCSMILGGVETGDVEMMNQLKRNLSTKQIKQAVKNLHNHGIACTALVMYGLPNQSIESMSKTLELLRAVNFDDIWQTMFFPPPGSQLYYQFKKTNQIDYQNISFNSSKSCFDYHNLEPRFHRLIGRSKQLANKKRFISNHKLLKSFMYRNYYLSHPQVFIKNICKKRHLNPPFYAKCSNT